MTASVNGKSFVSYFCTSYRNPLSPYFTIAGTAENEELIGIILDSSAFKIGTHPLNPAPTGTGATYVLGTKTSTAITGSVTIVSINPGKNVSGTFQFICDDGTVVSDGAFTAME
jgi:hypothetical protein